MSDQIQKAIDGLSALPELQPNEIRIILDGGIIQEVLKGYNVSPSVVVNICDYDVDGLTSEEITEQCSKDSDGKHCVFIPVFIPESVEGSTWIKGIFTSDWEGIEIHSPAIVDPETGEIEIIGEPPDVQGIDGLFLERETFEPAEESSIANVGGVVDVCMNCHQYIMRNVMVDTDGTNLEPGLECMDSECLEANGPRLL